MSERDRLANYLRQTAHIKATPDRVERGGPVTTGEDAYFQAWLASHHSGMHWSCAAAEKCYVERLAEARQPLLAALYSVLRQADIALSDRPRVSSLDAEWVRNVVRRAITADAATGGGE